MSNNIIEQEKENYISPTIEIIQFEFDDIITTSCGVDNETEEHEP